MRRIKVNVDIDEMYVRRLFTDINSSYSAAGNYYYIEAKEMLEQIKIDGRHLRYCSADLCSSYILRQGRKYLFSNLLIEKKYKNILNFKIYYENEWPDRFYKPENFFNVIKGIDIEDDRFFYKSEYDDCVLIDIIIPTNELEGRMVIKDTFVTGLYIPYEDKKLYLRNIMIKKIDDLAYLSIGFSIYEESFLRIRELLIEE